MRRNIFACIVLGLSIGLFATRNSPAEVTTTANKIVFKSEDGNHSVVINAGKDFAGIWVTNHINGRFVNLISDKTGSPYISVSNNQNHQHAPFVVTVDENGPRIEVLK